MSHDSGIEDCQVSVVQDFVHVGRQTVLISIRSYAKNLTIHSHMLIFHGVIAGVFFNTTTLCCTILICFAIASTIVSNKLMYLPTYLLSLQSISLKLSSLPRGYNYIWYISVNWRLIAAHLRILICSWCSAICSLCKVIINFETNTGRWQRSPHVKNMFSLIIFIIYKSLIVKREELNV